MKRTRSFPYDPLSISAARRFAVGALRAAPAEVVNAVELMVSELTTNSVRHGGTGFRVVITSRQAANAEEIRIEVTDSAGGRPTMRSPGPDDPTGRGLRIVSMLADAWGVEKRSGAGKTVWLTIAFSPSTEAGAGRLARHAVGPDRERGPAPAAKRTAELRTTPRRRSRSPRSPSAACRLR